MKPVAALGLLLIILGFFISTRQPKNTVKDTTLAILTELGQEVEKLSEDVEELKKRDLGEQPDDVEVDPAPLTAPRSPCQIDPSAVSCVLEVMEQ